MPVSVTLPLRLTSISSKDKAEILHDKPHNVLVIVFVDVRMTFKNMPLCGTVPV